MHGKDPRFITAIANDLSSVYCLLLTIQSSNTESSDIQLVHLPELG